MKDSHDLAGSEKSKSQNSMYKLFTLLKLHINLYLCIEVQIHSRNKCQTTVYLFKVYIHSFNNNLLNCLCARLWIIFMCVFYYVIFAFPWVYCSSVVENTLNTGIIGGDYGRSLSSPSCISTLIDQRPVLAKLQCIHCR